MSAGERYRNYALGSLAEAGSVLIAVLLVLDRIGYMGRPMPLGIAAFLAACAMIAWALGDVSRWWAHRG